MKLYSAKRYSIWDEILRFVGKNVWVKCRRFTSSGGFAGEFYLKLLSAGTSYGHDTYKVYSIDSGYIDSHELYQDRFDEDFRENIFTPRTVLADDYDIVRFPNIETYTNDEILEILGGGDIASTD